ncbi:prepilin-type N-terminal cleavage/methylation domain-containing protein [Paenibacillus chondroitinus]|uniref:Prepilin-type N-terminal cleavage/methylation domain-containing protein n=1 Tax=Paenibacillus chondroitinus TaxID=59842 RepID=A0ABU6DDP9_9BACL|nr:MULTISPECIES: prepilin-type N-terminal cleavage/methylation domain-containing protein [Paenibacillus]MCY9657377.1 prepilin-type N-terminal cleavage/methylation domain-containing protein [Paenibacillus anseongense]MEB4795884.1 prepilin-type N-terminal cleavage/methylation domain-containing protein [Paenibacillus chondroitinus]
MKKLLNRLNKDQKGFTLIELLAVIVILAVIAAIAIPLISNIISKSKEDADMATARQVYDAARLFLTNENSGDFVSEVVPVIGTTGTYASDGSGGGLQSKGYLESNLALPSSKAAITGGTVSFNSNGILTSVVLNISANEIWTFSGPDVIAGKGKGVKSNPSS